MQKRRPDEAIGDNSAVTAAWLKAAAIGLVVVLVDQLTKTWAEEAFFDEPRTIAGPLRFTVVYNEGMAFGIGSGVAPVLIAIVVLAALTLLLGRDITVNKPTLVGAGLVTGGAVGNLYDRLFRDHGGAVIDFIDVGWWPVFNVADMAVVGGAAVLAIWATRGKAAT